VATLFGVCFLIGIFSFGGGLVPWIHREVVAKRKWMSEDEFLNGVTLSQVLPGANVTNLVVFVGQRLIGPAGAAAALLGLLVGPFLAVIGLVTFYEAFSGLEWLNHSLDGAAAAAIGLLMVVAFKSARHAARSWISILFLAITVLTVGVLEWPLLPVVLVLGALSVAVAWARTGG
jgi:chromate transporter